MNLFEINSEIIKTMEEAIDLETGEILDEKLLDKLNSLELQKIEKIENIGKYIKNLASDIEQLKQQKEYFAKRQKAAENKLESLKKYLSFTLNGESFEAEDKSVKISFRNSKKIKILDETIIPKKWFIKQEPKLDRAGLLAQLKEGKKIKGVELEENKNIQIK